MNNNNIYISKLGLGCWSFRGGEYWGPMNQSVVNNIVRRAFELGKIIIIQQRYKMKVKVN